MKIMLIIAKANLADFLHKKKKKSFLRKKQALRKINKAVYISKITRVENSKKKHQKLGQVRTSLSRITETNVRKIE